MNNTTWYYINYNGAKVQIKTFVSYEIQGCLRGICYVTSHRCNVSVLNR
ncbi:hypothetical protein GCM10008014_22830 [Paenibacillus silvae]|uniref:Uncharacterized protein n=1 Tax=Paenibacillus silvae TaxID=1325358 RepID=A0ABQ1Z966_9BACL|nr:hypothetical protein GCM10008014_22830 [Paenibacillus silvae]